MVKTRSSAGKPGQAGRARAQEMREFILQALEPDSYIDVSPAVVDTFGVSRQLVYRQLKRLETAGLIEGQGNTKARVHKLRVTTNSYNRKVGGLEEDALWAEVIEPRLADVTSNVQSISHYGFTEIVNNVIDHSESEEVVVNVERTTKSLELFVSDSGIGIFRKIQHAMNLPSLQEAIFELTKGKFTTDPSKHTGEGIFYTSRVFDQFRLLSGGLYLSHEREGDDWLIGSDDQNKRGTSVFMTIDSRSTHTLEEVFEHYSSERDDYAFNKTNVVLRLLDTGDESFVSRSQAKRVLARLPRFKEVLLDFEGVKSIGPAFADEIFRVFAAQHPEVHLTPIRMSDDVRRMVDRAERAGSESQP